MKTIALKIPDDLLSESGRLANDLRLSRANPTFAVGRVERAKALYFQHGASKGLHYIFNGGRASSIAAAMRGGGWFGRVN
jgi:hypothetical protein